MRFTVPQFIEHEAKIVGPLTLKQFIFIGTAGAICVALYFLIGQKSFFLFLLLSIIVLAVGVGLAFLKIGGQSLPKMIVSFFHFISGSKLYIWKRKNMPIIISKKIELKKEGEETESSPKIVKSSQLEKMRTKIETKTK